MEQLAEKLGGYLSVQLQLDEERREVITFGALTMLHNGGSLLLTVLLAAATGLLRPTLLVLVAAGFMRHASGGAHLRASVRCMVTTAVAFVICGEIGNGLGHALSHLPWPVGAALASVGVAAGLYPVYRLAPVEAITRPLSTGHRARLRRLSLRLGLLLSVIIVLTGGLAPVWASPLLAGFLFQSLTLTPTGHSAAASLDRLIDGIWEGVGKNA